MTDEKKIEEIVTVLKEATRIHNHNKDSELMLEIAYGKLEKITNERIETAKREAKREEADRLLDYTNTLCVKIQTIKRDTAKEILKGIKTDLLGILEHFKNKTNYPLTVEDLIGTLQICVKDLDDELRKKYIGEEINEK